MAANTKQLIADLVTKVQTQTTVVAGIATTLNGLTQVIADLKNNTTDPVSLQALADAETLLDANTKVLTDAVVANTPAA